MPENEGWSGVTADDVLDRWPTSDSAPLDEEQITLLIGDAEDAIVRELPETPDRLASGAIPQRRIVRVIARMIIRLMRNPEGLRTFQQGAGSFNTSATYGGDHPGELYLTDDDRRDLTDTPGRGRRAFAFTPALRR